MGKNGSFFRPVVESMQGYVPGEQPQDRRYIKLNTNENPYPPSPRVIEALKRAITGDLRLYPDPLAAELRQKAAEVYGIGADRIIAGNGSDDLLSMLFRACIEKDEAASVAYPVPTYSLYDTLAQIQDVVPKTTPFLPDFALPIDALLALHPRLTIVCNPNSPSGTLVPVSTVEELARRSQGLVVVDEAYVDFARESALSLLARLENVVVLRSFSKSFSLAGMRIGLAFGSHEVIAQLHKVKDSYNLDRMSLVAARVALEDYAWMEANVARIRTDREQMASELRAMGFRVPSSEANFVFAQNQSIDGKELYEKLRDAGILVRHFPTEALAAGVRITVGTGEENHALLSALRSFIVK